MKLEIVSHCWRYTRLLRYQLSSLVLHPPTRLQVLMTVFLTEEDQDTVATLDYFARHEKSTQVVIRPWFLPREQLFMRLIGRNLAALATEADWIWFADCDYVFGPDCLDSLTDAVVNTESPLVFPRTVLKNRSHALGDRAIAEAAGGPRVMDIEPDDFEPTRYRRAIGGVQITSGDVVRQIGYCRDCRRQHRIASSWKSTKDDVQFRRSLGTAGKAIELPNLYRLRHSVCGQRDAEVSL